MGWWRDRTPVPRPELLRCCVSGVASDVELVSWAEGLLCLPAGAMLGCRYHSPCTEAHVDGAGGKFPHKARRLEAFPATPGPVQRLWSPTAHPGFSLLLWHPRRLHPRNHSWDLGLPQFKPLVLLPEKKVKAAEGMGIWNMANI